MARAEVSALFHLKWFNERPVTRAYIGSGLSIEMLDDKWLQEIKNQCPEVGVRELIEWNTPYTHRIFYEVEAEEDRFEDDAVTDKEKQLILKAIILSRLVKPTSIAYDSVWVKSFCRSDGKATHYHEHQVMNNLNVAFVIPRIEDFNTITTADVEQMAELWDSFQFLFDNEKKYRRIVRAIKTNEIACSIYFPEMSHTIMHAALESLICTGYTHNKAQVTQRLSQLVSFVSRDQAEDIYKLCGGFKHAAEAMLQEPSSASRTLGESDQKRVDAVILLRRAIRDLLIRALRERAFADLLADKDVLRKNFPVYDRKNKVLPV